MASSMPFERYELTHDPRSVGKVSTWICIDDRFALVNTPYRQIAGGSQGVGIDAAVSGNMRRLRRGWNPHKTPTHVVASLATQEAARHNIELLNHRACAAEAAAAVISRTITEQPEKVLPVAQTILPDLDSGEYELVADAHLVTQVGDASQLTTVDRGVRWGGHAFSPVRRVALTPIDHVASDIIANHHTGVAFDAQAALEDGSPAYHASFGDLNEIHDAITPAFGSRQRDFLAAAAIRTAATSLYLPKPVADQDLQIHTLGI